MLTVKEKKRLLGQKKAIKSLASRMGAMKQITLFGSVFLVVMSFLYRHTTAVPSILAFSLAYLCLSMWARARELKYRQALKIMEEWENEV